MENRSTSVSVIIPCRNEKKFIGKCLDSVICQSYSVEKCEIFVVDGISEDKTAEIVSNYCKKYPFIYLLKNPKRITPISMNIGLKAAKGDVKIMVNAHSVLDKDFIHYNIEYLEKTGADAVGGKLNTINENNGLIARAIPLAADSVFGSGGNRYRSNTKEGFVNDTLPYCAYPQKTFVKFGLIDEELVRDQDEEFNYRILKNGGKIFFTPKIKSNLYIRPSLAKLWRQHYQYGYFKPLVSKKVGTLLTWRQLIPAIFVASLVVTLLFSFIFSKIILITFFVISIYLIADLSFSVIISLKEGLKYAIILSVIFPVLHISYGLGYIMGVIRFIILNKKVKYLPITR